VRRDLLSILEAVYSESEDEDTWLGSVLNAATASLDSGLGAMVGTYRLGKGASLQTLKIVRAHGACSDLKKAMEAADLASAIGSRPDAEPVIEGMFPSRPAAGLFSRLSGLGPSWRWDPTFRPFWERAGPSVRTARDVFGVVGTGHSDRGPVLVSVVRSAAGPSTAVVTAWTRIAAHLALGFRLVRSLRARVDAVLDPAGRVHHLGAALTAEERASLSASARAIEVARGRLRRTNPDRAIALWKGLISGRWTLVDHFDTDGRRYVLAKRNVRERPWHTLTHRESSAVALAAQGQPHKVIASALGIALTSVSARLARAAEKIGVESRMELVSAYRAAREDPGA
jgi:DNA-binding NarL/FixJ family response regulator